MSLIFDNNYYDDKTITRAFSLKNTHIGYENLALNGTITASDSAAGFPPTALNNEFTYDFWRSNTLPASVIIDTGSQNFVDYLGIAKHNLINTQIVLSSSVDGLSYAENARFVLTSNDAAMLIFEEVQARYFKIETIFDDWTECGATIAECGHPLAACGLSTDIASYAQIAVISVGKSLEMQRMIFGGHSPAKLYQEAELRPNISEGGQWLGRSVIRRGTPCEYSFSNLTGAWYRANFDQFRIAAITKPFFIAWRPLGYASECQFAWTDKSIRPENTGPNDWLSVSFSVIGCE